MMRLWHDMIINNTQSFCSVIVTVGWGYWYKQGFKVFDSCNLLFFNIFWRGIAGRGRHFELSITALMRRTQRG